MNAPTKESTPYEASLAAFGGRLLYLGVVLAGDAHNPSILNPDFLKHNKIVPGDWQPQSVLTTPTSSRVEYKNFSIQVDKNRVALIEFVSEGAFKCPEVARNYLKNVPLVRYTAVGINPFLCITRSEGRGREIILDSIIKDGPWKLHDSEPPFAGSNFKFDLGDRKISLKIFCGDVEISAENKMKNTVVFGGNIHFDIPQSGSDSSRVARDILGDFDEHLEEYFKLAEKITGGLKL